MKVADRLIGRPRWPRPRGFGHLQPGPQLVLAVDHHALAGRQALIDHRQAVLDLRHPDLGDPRALVVAHGVDVGALRAALHGGGRHRERAPAHAQHQPGIDVLAGPQGVPRVAELRLEPDRAGGVVDLVVQQREAPAGQRLRLARRTDLNLQRPVAVLERAGCPGTRPRAG
jgi:hypothetical protein